MYVNGINPDKILRNVYRSITHGKICRPSTSKAHKVAHKIFVEWLLSTKFEDRRLCLLDAERVFGKKDKMYVADVVAYWYITDDSMSIEAVEVQNPLHYMYTVHYRDRRNLHNMLNELRTENAIERDQYETIMAKLKNHNYRGSKRNTIKGRRVRSSDYFHFYTDRYPEQLKISGKVNIPYSEIERKYKKWEVYHSEGFFDELSFLVGAGDLDQFRRDAKQRNIPVSRFYTIEKELVEQIISMNKRSIHDGLRPLSKPSNIAVEDMIKVNSP